ncbi:MAG TPA: GspE/PulE family protein, partial [Gemmatimonadales bacterium]|nr:GspE/PulE family protein [Gemmatimonadales bacterium]
MAFTDSWLISSIESLIGREAIDALKPADGQPDVALWWTLTSKAILTDDQILGAASQRLHIPIADLATISPSKVRDGLPEHVARRYQVVPVRLTDSVLEVATASPFDIEAEKMLAFATGRDVRMVLASPGKIAEKLEEIYRPENVVENILSGIRDDHEVTQIEEEQEESDLLATTEEASARPVVRLVDAILSEGIIARASDIHIEPSEGGVVVRYRIDGVLVQKMKIPRSAGVPLISRIKIISSLDIADRLRPQDGRARMSVNGQPVDLRVSTLPASLGEKVVIRILNAQSTALDLDALGLYPEETTELKALLDNKDGIILVTGPTGSGKTTTLYSAIRFVQDEGVNIVTVEDPVEYRLSNNIVQVQVNPKAGLTFASALRSILRQDPDVVLVGEMRDLETIEAALTIAETGHLCFGTLHTNSAIQSINRIIDVFPSHQQSQVRAVLSFVLEGVICQALIPKATGTGRVLASEVMVPNPAIRNLIREDKLHQVYS